MLFTVTHTIDCRMTAAGRCASVHQCVSASFTFSQHNQVRINPRPMWC